MTRFLTVIIGISFFNQFFSQSITGVVLSKKTNIPITNVAVKTDQNNGTVTNESGVFTINISKTESFTFSSLGYQPKEISLNLLKKNNYKVYLQEDINILKEVKIIAKPINLDSLLAKTTQKMCLNYIKENETEQVFYTYNKQVIQPTKASNVILKRTNLLDKKNKKLARAELDSLVEKYADKPGRITEEFYVTVKPVLLKNNKESKTEIIKKNTFFIEGFKENYIDQTVSVDEMDLIFKNMLLKYLDTTKIYKVKSGLFTLDKNVSYSKITNLKDSVENDNTFLKNTALVKHNSIKKQHRFFFNKDETNFLNKKYYKHSLGKPFFINDEKFYPVSFYPKKSKSKYSGELLINATDYVVKKISYAYATSKKGKSINLKFLLGVKFSEKDKEITIHYKKDSLNNIYVKYFKESKTSYAYINRPLSFTERKGWFENKDKIKIEVIFEVNYTENTEFLYVPPVFTDKRNIDLIYKNSANNKIPYLTKAAYESKKWYNKTLINKYLDKNIEEENY